MPSITENITEIRSQMLAACDRSGRDPQGVSLCVVTKTFPPDALQEAYDAGEHLFGENRVQEMLEKAPVLPTDIQWHLIGHLQSNKVRKAIATAGTVQSVDSLGLAQQISRIATETGTRVGIYLQVNIARDAAKHGWLPEALLADISQILTLPALDIHGLMTIPELAEGPEQARPHFAALRTFRDTLEQTTQRTFPGLSMGMSGDFVAAIEEGATLVRVGSRIFGKR